MKVLIVKTSSLGDIIHTFPVIDYLKQHFPDVQIDWVIEKSCVELIQSHPQINRAIVVDTKHWRRSLVSKNTWKEISDVRKAIKSTHYDVAFDLQGNTKSGIILSWVSSDRKVGFGRKFVSEWPNILFTKERINLQQGRNIREDYLSVVKQSLNLNKPYSPEPLRLEMSPDEATTIEPYIQDSKRTILICPGSRWENKRVANETLEELVDLINAKYSDVYCLYSWGNESERLLCQQLQQRAPGNSAVLPKLGLPTLQYLMGRVDFVFAMDSLPLHLAGTTETPTLGVFGPSNAKKYAPIGKEHRFIQGTCPYNKTFEKRCPILRSCKTGACIKKLRADELVYQVEFSSQES